MAVIEGGVSASLAEVGAAAAIPLHVTTKPIPYGALGHYRISRRYTPVASATAGANFVAFRNPSANLTILTRLRIAILQTAAPTAAIEHRIGAFVQRGYTAADGTGIGTTLTLTGNNAKKRTSMATTGVVITETNAAGGLTGGTKTPDSDVFISISAWITAAVTTVLGQFSASMEWSAGQADGAHPHIFAQNEGFTLQNLAALGAASGVQLYYDIEWAEVTAY